MYHTYASNSPVKKRQKRKGEVRIIIKGGKYLKSWRQILAATRKEEIVLLAALGGHFLYYYYCLPLYATHQPYFPAFFCLSFPLLQGYRADNIFNKADLLNLHIFGWTNDSDMHR